MDSSTPLAALVEEGINVSILGMCIVFSVLVLICIILAVMNSYFKRKYQDGQSKIEAVSENEAPAVAIPQNAAPAPDDENLIAAVLAAAVASMLGSTGFVIRSIKRQSSWRNR
jgi:sodium pump decarboxylase gamma subunit